MRILIRLLVLLAVIWCGWWALASYGVSQAINGWAEARRAQGWQVETSTAQRGFPLNIATRVNAVQIAVPKGSAMISATGGSIRARTYWPGHIDINLPQDPIVFLDSNARSAVQTTNGQLRLRLRPGLALELASAQFDADAVVLGLNDTEVLRADQLAIAADQASTNRARYDLRITADALTPGALPRQLLALPGDWPKTFDSFAVTGAVTFDAPLTRGSLETPPQFRQITLTDAQIIWGAVRINGTGAFDVGPDGIPDGDVTLQIKGWRGMLDLAQGAGLLPAERRGQSELMLGLLAGRAGSPDDLDLAIVFRDAQMSLSGIPLGPAPRLVLR